MKKKVTLLMAVLGLLAMSGLASAATDEDKEDTTFNFGYDEENRVLNWGTSPSDGPYDCALEGDPVDATYGSTENVAIQIPLLERDGGVVTFPARPQEELAEGLVEADGPVEYSGSDGECGVTGVSVEGPNGQVNHGMFMRAFNAAYADPGRGCLMRHLAQADLGKGDQHIQVLEVGSTESDEIEGLVGTVEFSTAAADCERGNGANGNGGELDEADDPNGGRPEDPGAKGRENAAAKKAAAADKKADGSDQRRGSSASAPGRNK